jgi:hypothetical protein
VLEIRLPKTHKVERQKIEINEPQGSIGKDDEAPA